MRPSLKLNDIDREHLQELYDAAGVAREQLPYTSAFEQIWQGFQDRTFKNAEREQLYGAMLKYLRSSSCPSKASPDSKLTDEQAKQLKSLLPRHAVGGKILPYSDEFEAARKAFNHMAGMDLTELEFWQGIIRAQGARRPPVRRPKPTAQRDETTDDDGE